MTSPETGPKQGVKPELEQQLAAYSAEIDELLTGVSEVFDSYNWNTFRIDEVRDTSRNKLGVSKSRLPDDSIAYHASLELPADNEGYIEAWDYSWGGSRKPSALHTRTHASRRVSSLTHPDDSRETWPIDDIDTEGNIKTIIQGYGTYNQPPAKIKPDRETLVFGETARIRSDAILQAHGQRVEAADGQAWRVYSWEVGLHYQQQFILSRDDNAPVGPDTVYSLEVKELNPRVGSDSRYYYSENAGVHPTSFVKESSLEALAIEQRGITMAQLHQANVLEFLATKVLAGDEGF